MIPIVTKIGFIISFLAIIFSCQKSDEINSIELQRTSYSENAKIARIKSFGGDKEYIIKEYEYDAQGRILKTSTPGYDNGEPTGKMMQYDLYKYDVNGRLERIENFNWNVNDQSYWNLQSTIFTYNDNGEKIKETYEYPKIGKFSHKLFYYKNHRLVKMEEFDEKGQLTSYSEYEYNNEGNMIKEIKFNQDKNPYNEIRHKFVNGMNVETMRYSLNNGKREEYARISRQFDQNKNLIIEQNKILALWSSEANYSIKYEYFTP